MTSSRRTGYNHDQRLTNPDYLKSDCANCRRMEDDFCRIGHYPTHHIDYCTRTYTKCGYWDPWQR